MFTLSLYRRFWRFKARFLLPKHFLTKKSLPFKSTVLFFATINLSEENRIKTTNFIKKSLDLLNHNRVREMIVPLIDAAAYHPHIGKAILMIELGYPQEGLSLLETVLKDDLNLQDICWLIKGIIYNALDEDDEASKCFNLAKTLARNDIIKSWAFFYNSLLLKKRSWRLSNTELLHAKNLNPDISNFNVSLQEITKIVKSYILPPNVDIVNRVMVRVWLPDRYFSKAYGHAALQTYHHYISFWPGDRLADFFEDIKDMGRLPDFRLSLYQLDVKKIDQAFEKFKQSGCRWNLMGEGIFNDEKTRNCSSLTWFMLQQGGLGKWYSYYFEGIFNLIIGGIIGGIGAASVFEVVVTAVETLFLSFLWMIYGVSGLLYGVAAILHILSLPFLLFNPSRELPQFPQPPSPPPKIELTKEDIYRLFILLCSGVFGMIYGSREIMAGSYKTFQKLMVTTPQNIVKLAQNAVIREQTYPLSFLFKSPSVKKRNPSIDNHDSLSAKKSYTR